MVFSGEISSISTQDKKWMCWQIVTRPNWAPHIPAKCQGILKGKLGRRSAVTCWGPHFEEKRQYKVSVRFQSLRLLGIGQGALPPAWGNFIQIPQSLQLGHQTNICLPTRTPIDSPEAVCLNLASPAAFPFRIYTTCNLSTFCGSPFLHKGLKPGGNSRQLK